MKQLSGQDAMWIHLETNKTPMHIGVLYVFDSPGKKFDFKDFKQFFEDRLHLSRIFRQRLVEAPMGIGSPFWADDPDFDINHHMFHVALPKPGGRKLLKELAARHYSPPLDRTRPLWKATFITDINIPELSEDAFAMLVQVHHAAIDGKSGVEIMASILSMTEEPFVPAPPEKPWKPKKLPSAAELLTKNYGGIINKPKKFLKLLKETNAKRKEVAKEMSKDLMKLPPKPLEAPKTFMNVPSSGQKVIGGIDIPLADIKKIKNAVPGATVNDVLLAICAGGLRKYMVKHGRLPLKNLVGLAPISVRKEDEKGDMGNRISAMLIDLATNEVDPIRRLEAMVLNTKASKVSSKALPADQIMEFVPSEVAALAGRAYMQLGLSQLHNPFFNLIVTNVPGPPIPLYMNGYKLQRIYGLGAAMDGLGLMMIIFSYAGVISLSATADANVMENMDLYMSLLRDSYEDLYDAVEELELEEA